MNIISFRNFLFLLVLLFSQTIFSQQETSSDSLIAEQEGNLLFQKANGFFGENSDSTKYYMQLALQKFEVSKNWEKYISCFNTIAVCYYINGEFEPFYEYSQEVLRMAEKYLPKENKVRNDAMYNLALSFTERGQYQKAIDRLEIIYTIEEKTKDTERKGSTLGSLGYNYLKFGDFEESLNHYHQGLELWQDTVGFIRYANEARVMNHIGNCYFESGLIDSAIATYQLSLKKINHPEVGKGNIQGGIKIRILLDLAEAYLLQNNFSSAIVQMDQAKKLAEGVYFENQGLLNELLGRIHLKQGNPTQAISNFKKSKELVEEEFKIYKKHYLVAEKDIWIGKSLLATGKLNEALHHFHLALSELSNDSLGLKISQNPNLENLLARNIALEALAEKAKTQFLIFQKENNPSHLKQSNATYLLATQLIQNLRQDYLGKDSKQNLSSKVLPIFEEAIKVAINCFEMTQDSFYLNQAFTFSESNKAIILLESINENSAKGFGGIPSKLLLEEEDRRIEIAFYKKTINELKQQSSFKIQKIKDLENKLFDEQKKYNQLITKFEKEYPQYYQLKYSTKLATVKDIQTKILKSKQTLIEYFFGEKNIYIFSITQTQLKVQTIKKEKEIIAAILEVNQLISHPPSNNKQDFKRFTHQANFLFDKLLKNSLHQKMDNLIIVPDDLLNYLPFEVLLTQPNNNTITNYSFDNLDYLLKSYPINYSYSSALLLNNLVKKEKEFSETFIGFAPSFGNTPVAKQRTCSQNELSALHCNADEVERIKNLINGKTLIGEVANLDNFYKNSNACKILHLATHACIDDKNPLFNKIHFADDYISNNDLYNLQLNAELTVLSACNTGTGQLAKGEGVMSLSRGFIHAGCPSVVMSLWSVDDCATSDIMYEFYKNLKSNQTKNKALQNAKIDFLKNAKKAQQHPYFWAGFVQIGDESSMNFSKFKIGRHWILLISGLLIAILFWFFDKSFRRK